ncbi:TonB-dependent receptor [Aurantiacibacter suaedae]|uniref:TonB-dependent receptor n=1 Tax=Aurantiacibacter suaedae TaxID=2545755 RepID=UPI0010F80A1D|nr:TonB-dependent receptor [Aurantiacibacter suaedae]
MRIELGGASALVIAALTASSAAAQTADGSDKGDMIIVEGQKIDQSLQQVTASVDVTTAEEIEREPVTDLYDIITRVPNVTAAFGEQGFAIRGIDQRGIGGNGATLTVYVDDSPLGNQTTFFGPTDSWDLGQVEVYRGPQSTNFGRNALAGAIYLRTRDPSYEWDVRLRGEVGDNGQRQVAAAVGGPLVDDAIAFRASANYRESDGFIYNTFLDENADATELKTGRFKLLLEPTDSLSIISTSSYTENFAGEDSLDPTNGNPGVPLAAEDVSREVAYDTPGREGTESFIQSVKATWDLSSLVQVQSITTYQSTDYVRQEDFDVTPAPVAALDRTGSDEAWSEEFRVKYLGDRLSAVAGFYFFTNEDGVSDSFVVPATIVNPGLPPSILFSRTSQATNETTNFALFGDGEYRLSERFDLLFGLRYDNEEVRNIATAITDAVDPLPPGFEFLAPLLGTETSTVEAQYEAWLPKLGLRWNASEDTNLSFVVQRAYRAGGAEISVLDGSANTFDPEYMWNYEVAARTTMMDGRLRWNTNIFYSDWKDQQVSEPVPGFSTFFTTVNAGKSTLYGVETDLSFDVTRSLQVYGGLGYSFTEFDDFPNGNYDPSLPEGERNQPNFAGNRFAIAPRWSGNLGVAYRAASGFFGGIDASYQSAVFNSAENFAVNECCERVLANARIGYAWENVSVSAYLRNALDEEYYAFINSAVSGDETARLGDPRTFAVRLDLDF